jgi:hypothetical protein
MSVAVLLGPALLDQKLDYSEDRYPLVEEAG